MVGVKEGREFRFRGDLYSQESTFPQVLFTSAKDEVIWFDSLVSDQSLAFLHVLHIN